MRKNRLAVFAAVLALGASACKRDVWVDFESPEGPSGSFAAAFPIKPTLKPSHVGSMYVAMDPDGISYDVGMSSVPPEFRNPDATERMFDEMQKALTAGETSATRQGQIRLGEYPGREIVVERKTGIGLAVFTGRAYRVRNTIFTLTVRAPAGKSNDPNIKRFLESFRIVKPPMA
jgi:hypothetical protein